MNFADRFCNHRLWRDAAWIATTFRCHPSGDAPPVMGLVFANSESGLKLFAVWTDDWGNADEVDAIRVAVVEGDIPGQMAGYSIHLSAAADGASPGQVQRLRPSRETQSMLGQFKAQYRHHGEFLLCPVVQKADGQLWFDANSGIIKREIVFRSAADIAGDDVDAVVLAQSVVE